MSASEHKRAELDLLCALGRTTGLTGTTLIADFRVTMQGTGQIGHAVRAFDLLEPMRSSELSGMEFGDGLRVIAAYINVLQLRITLLEQQLQHEKDNAK